MKTNTIKILPKLLLILVLFHNTQSEDEEGMCRTYDSISYCSAFSLQPGQHLELKNPHGTITEINLYNCSIASIPSEFFNEFKNAEIIHMYHVGASVIESDAFHGMKNLKKLGLSGNDMPEIQGNLFNDLVSLVELDLPFNNLIEITPEAFAGLNNLIYLDLSYNDIKTIHPESFLSLTSLQSLNLTMNKIKELKVGTFKTMKNLQELLMGRSNLFKLENHVFDGLSSLQHLNLGTSSINYLDTNCFINLSELIYLDLSLNSVKTIPVGVFATLHKLETLILNHNELINLSGNEFSGLTQLKKLLINNNKISQLGAENLLTHHPNLVNVNLNNNKWQCDSFKLILDAFNNHHVQILDNYTRTSSNVGGIECTNNKMLLETTVNTVQELTTTISPPLVRNGYTTKIYHFQHTTTNTPREQRTTTPKTEENINSVPLELNYEISNIVEKFEEGYKKHSIRMTIINAIVVWISLLVIILLVVFVVFYLYRRKKLNLSSYSVRYNDVTLLSDCADS